MDHTSSNLNIVRLKYLEYAHITDENTNVTRLIEGPITYSLASHETISKQPTAYHIVKPGYYATVLNPHKRTTVPAGTAKDDTKENTSIPVTDAHGQVVVNLGETEYRYSIPPFPLYPDEQLESIRPLLVLSSTEALLISVNTNDTSLLNSSNTAMGGLRRNDIKQDKLYLFKGPGTYYPSPNEEIKEKRNSIVTPPGGAIHFQAIATFTTEDGVEHYGGEEYLQLNAGRYFAGVFEEVVGTIDPVRLSIEDACLHIQVKQSYVDPRPFAKGKKRAPGEIFSVTCDECPSFIVHPYDTVLRKVHRIYLSARDYAFVIKRDPGSAENEQHSELGRESNLLEARRCTNTSFFLQPGEELSKEGIKQSYILDENEALLLRALVDFEDTEVNPPVMRKSGEQWLLLGPRSYIPDNFAEIRLDSNGREIRKRILLTEGEGIYVRNSATGAVRTVVGPTAYMLEATETLWQKSLSPTVAACLVHQSSSNSLCVARAKNNGPSEESNRGIVYYIPHRSVTQVYNYKTQEKRIIFGPDRLLLEPDEEFTMVSLSAIPWDPQEPIKCLSKEPNRVDSLFLFLGPSNMNDIVYVETRDHARLALKLSYDWYFDISPGDAEAAQRCFSVDDFVGDSCSFIASRIRALVASLPFDRFHKDSARLLKEAVFGVDPQTGKALEELRFDANNFVVTSVDTQELEVLDSRTRQGLQKSVKMAIEIATQAQQANAQQIASAREQESKGLLERQRMEDQVKIEEQRRVLLECESNGMVIVSSGKSCAIAEAMSQAGDIESNAATEAARIRAERGIILNDMTLSHQQKRRDLEHKHEASMQHITQEHQAALSEIRAEKIASIIEALGPDTISEISNADSELQAKLLSSLGLEGYLITDGSSPINLLKTASGLA